ncbi:MAG: 1-acyl-sn-glycerol-3-phosphate acyltransferase [Chloroflexi bacterium]|nr:1-acyl-sn-glycerol-3-phosphate acyltransferase [Chloroflexota bacterium]
MQALRRRVNAVYVDVFWWFMTALARFLFVVFSRWRVEGKEFVPPMGPLIVVSNHMSMIDPSLVTTAVPRRITFMAKSELYRHWFTRWLVRSYGSVRIVRGRGQRQTLETLANVLRRDGTVHMFPEGTRSNGQLARASPGTAQLALQTGAPILPVAITGSQRVTRFKPGFTRPRLTVSIGQPFTLPLLEGPVQKAQLNSMGDMIMDRIAALLPPEYRGHYATKPRAPSAT